MKKQSAAKDSLSLKIISLKITRFTISLALIVTAVTARCQQPEGALMLRNFFLQSSLVVSQSGEQLSSGPYHGLAYWFPVQVPSTVLSGLVANKIYPSPYIGMNNMRIPDASDAFNKEYHLGKYSFLPHHENPWKAPYWYRTTFQLPKQDTGRRVWLIFKGINYRASVWLNGSLVADSSEMAGMFAQYRFDITDRVKPLGTNFLAVKIYPLDDPGLPAPPQLKALGPFYANGGPTGDIGKNVTMLCSVGWDWMPAVRDRNMGIWQPVFLSFSGPVTINEPHVITRLPDLPDTTQAEILLKMKLENHENEDQKGQIQISLKPYNFKGTAITFTKNEHLKGNESREVSFSSKQIIDFQVRNPHLWWPSGQGKPNLYRLEICYRVKDRISDTKSMVFGIRSVSSKVTNVNGWPRRDFYVNGRRIHLVGGAWVPDMLLQRDSLRYAIELQLIQQANLNLVRIWGGGIAPPDVFFNIADRLGLLVWQDFWITGDTQGEFKGSPNWPLEGAVFIRNVKSTIRRLRNHPSLLLWTGGNEGHARKSLYNAMREEVATLDGTRPFIPCSSGFAKLPAGWKKSWPDNQDPGVYSGGPYSWQDPVTYYKLVNGGKDWVFKDETGVPSQVPYNTLPQVIPDLVPDDSMPYPLNNTWGYHDACAGGGQYRTYYNAIVNRYGPPNSYRDYSEKSQLVNANSYRAIFEAVNSKFDATGGVMLWKLNAAFPSVIWQLYDWFLNPNAGYYFTKKACEPLHVQFNLDDSTVVVVNRRIQEAKGLEVRIRVFDLQGTRLTDRQIRFNALPQNVTPAGSLKQELQKLHRLVFVLLDLNGKDGKLISQNIYWLSPGNRFESMITMPKVRIKSSILKKQNNSWDVVLENPGNTLAFFVHLSLMNEKGDEILPSFWSDNYLSLAPHQKKILHLRVNPGEVTKKMLHLNIAGWNVPSRNISLPKL